MTTDTAAYTANRQALYRVTRTLAELPAVESFNATDLRAEQAALSTEGRVLAAGLPKRLAAEIDDAEHCARFPEWAAARSAGYRFTQPRLLRDARRSRPSRMVG